MAEIVLSRGLVTLVDDADYGWLNSWKWYADKSPPTEYARRNIQLANGKRSFLLMHRVIFGDSCTGMDVDHRNGSGLDNRRQNLRVCTHRQNVRNQTRVKSHSSRYKGVSWHKANRKWVAVMVIEKKMHYLGSFHDEEQAARAYDAKAKEQFGEFAAPNFRD